MLFVFPHAGLDHFGQCWCHSEVIHGDRKLRRKFWKEADELSDGHVKFEVLIKNSSKGIEWQLDNNIEQFGDHMWIKGKEKV